MNNPNLFVGTNFTTNYQKAILSDIGQMLSFFPNIKALNYPKKPYHSILLQGFVLVQVGNSDVPFPINMMLPDNFPSSPPIVQIPFAQNIPFQTSQTFGPDKIVRTEKFYNWIPMKSTLPQFVNSIILYFSQYPPITPDVGAQLKKQIPTQPNINNNPQPNPGYNNPQPQPGYNNPQPGYNYQQPIPPKPQPQTNLPDINSLFETAYAQAISILDTNNSKIRRCNNTASEYLLLKHLSGVIDQKNKDFETEIPKLQDLYDKQNNPEIPKYQVDLELQKYAEENARIQVFEELNELLKDIFRNGTITIDQYMNAIRSNHRRYFDNHLYPLSK